MHTPLEPLVGTLPVWVPMARTEQRAHPEAELVELVEMHPFHLVVVEAEMGVFMAVVVVVAVT